MFRRPVHCPSFYSYVVEAKRPNLARKIVALDVCGEGKPDILTTLVLVFYQLWVIMAFLVGRNIGNMMAQIVSKTFLCYQSFHLAEAFMCYTPITE